MRRNSGNGIIYNQYKWGKNLYKDIPKKPVEFLNGFNELFILDVPLYLHSDHLSDLNQICDTYIY